MPQIHIARRKVVHRTVWEVFRAPVLIAAVTTAGLAFALFGNGLWDAISWLTLAVPVIVAVFYWIKGRPISPGNACGKSDIHRLIPY